MLCSERGCKCRLSLQPCTLGGDVRFKFNSSLDVLLNTQGSGQRFQHLNFIGRSFDGLAICYSLCVRFQLGLQFSAQVEFLL